MGYYADHYHDLRYPINHDKSKGLRNAQLGAIHAIASNATLNSKETAMVVMPTGSGKTAVLMMAPYVLQIKKVLIVTPSIMVRGQIFDDYSALRTLKNIGVFPQDIDAPKVYELKTSFSEEQRSSISSADCIVATPHVALSLAESDMRLDFDYVIIDEAHHVPADTWQKILDNMNHAAALLVTATPFRLDKKSIKGRSIYVYPLSRAYQDGIFGEISYIPVEESPNKDIKIATEAERVLMNDRAQGYNHYLMVRTDTKQNAKELEMVYAAHTNLRLKRIDSSTTYSSVVKSIENLKQGEIDGIICVNMLGEGFDFPNLKIAAIHAPHKSLASTLQFIGRFARTNASDIGSAKFVAMNDEDLRIENFRLFSSDAVWQDMIIDMSEKKIENDINIENSLRQYVRDETADISSISLHSIRPNCHAKVYHVASFNIHGCFPDSCGIDSDIYRDEVSNTIVAITQEKETPVWLNDTQISNIENILYIIHYQPTTSLLFIYSQHKSESFYDMLAHVFADGINKIPRNEMHRVLAGKTDFEFFNTGMQNRYAGNGESYRILAGSNTADVIDETTGKMRSAGHAFCKANQSGTPVTIGYSSGSKIWSSTYLSIPQYVTWCDECGKLIADNSLKVKTNTNYDFLPLPERLIKYPSNIAFCFLDENVYMSPPSIFLYGEDNPKQMFTDIIFAVDSIKDNCLTITAAINSAKDTIHCNLEGIYSSIGNTTITIMDGKSRLTLSEYLNSHPLQFKTTDDTLIVGNEILSGNPDAIVFSSDFIRTINWKHYGTNIKKECVSSNSKEVSIQKTVKSILEADQENQFIIYDHGTGEIADFIVINEKESSIHVSLYHIKGMSGANYNSSVEDIYEVLQQAVKSTIWLKSRSVLLQKILSRRQSGHCELTRGRLDDLKKALRKSKSLTATMYVVQPSISKSRPLPDKYQEVLAASKFYILNSGRVSGFTIWGS